MKQNITTLKLSLVALVMSIGLGGAVIGKIQGYSKTAEQIYSWTSPGQPPFTGTVAQAEAYYGCTSGPLVCATGTAPGIPNVIITKPD